MVAAAVSTRTSFAKNSGGERQRLRRRVARAGLLTISATVPAASLTDLETAIDVELERIKSGPIADAELKKARSAAQRNLVGIMGSTLGRAVYLSQDAMFYGQPDWFAKAVDRTAKVTAADVQRVATRYLDAGQPDVVITIPQSGAKGGL